MVELHKQIIQFKNRLSAIHHKCSKQHLFAYADEHVFSFNSRNNRKMIFHKPVCRMMDPIPYAYPSIKNAFRLFYLILKNKPVEMKFTPVY